ncbi:YbfB/YjiJ family MFS transporter [Megalodesulfovibrio paquesii]
MHQKPDAVSSTSLPPAFSPLPGLPILPILGGWCALVVAMGIGRFAYTVLLPGMMTAHHFGEDVAGMMAAWNYAGYLLGVLAMRSQQPGRRRYLLLLASLTLSVASTAAMYGVDTVWLWHTLRFVAGLASGGCFVLASAIVLDTLLAVRRPVLGGLLYSGVGSGIVLGGLAAGPLEAAGGPDTAWLGMAMLALPLAILAGIALRPGLNRVPEALHPPATAAASRHSHPQHGTYRLLLTAYFLEGFGYIIGTTFLVALVQETTQSAQIARTAWLVTGAAAAVTAPLWRLAARKGYRPMLILAFLLQGVGVLLPAVSNTPIAALAGGLLLGGTFMGIVVLSLQYGVTLSGRASAHTVAVMTALYGVGQILGPFLAGMGAGDGGSSGQGQGFAFAFILSAISLFIAAGLLLAGAMRATRQHP